MTRDPGEPGLLVEFLWFLRHHKRWWVTPILLVFLLLLLLVWLASGGESGFTYDLF